MLPNRRLKNIVSVTALALGLLFSRASFAQHLTIQGKVTTASGQPIVGSATKFRVQIISPDPANHCVLYDETHTVDLSLSYGLFSINLGDVNASRISRDPPTNYSLEQVISNRAAISVPGNFCAPVVSGTATYVPAATDVRKVLIQFLDPATMGSAWETIPEMDLNPVAYAMDARSIGGYPASTILRVTDMSGTPANFPALTSAEATELQALAGGSSTKYVSKGGAAGVQVPNGAPTTPAAGSIWFEGSNLKFSDGINPPYTLGTSSGTITNVTAGLGLTGGGSTGSITLGLSPSGVGTGATKGSATMVPQITYDTYGRITGVSEQAITGTLPGAGAAGQILKSDGTGWASAPARTADLKSISDEGSIFPAVTCTASQSLYWNSVSDKFACQNIALGAPSATVANSYKLVTVAADGRVNGGSSPTTLSGFGITDALSNANGVSNFSSGNTASRPATSTTGALYVDTQALTLYRYSGSAWDIIGSAGAGGSLTGVTAGTGLSGGGSSGSVTLTLSSAGITAGNYFKVSTDAYGRVLSGNAALVAADIPNLDWAKIASGKPTSLSGYGITDAMSSTNGVPAIASGNTAGRPAAGVAGRLYVDTQGLTLYRDNGTGWDTIGSAGAGASLTGVTAGGGLTGGGSSGNVTLAMDTAGITSGTYYKVTTDTYGRVLSGANALVAGDIPALDWAKITTGKPTTLAGYGIAKNYVENASGALSLSAGNTAAQPTAGTAGRIYIDTQTNTVSYDTGALWQTIVSGAGFTGSLAGEVSGGQGATQVDAINGISRATITSNLNAVTAATDAATNSALVKRDSAGDFASRNITAAQVKLKDGTTNTVALKAAATSATYSLQLPAVAPTAGQSLQADGAGVFSWVTAAAGALTNILAGNGISVTGSGATRTVALTDTLVSAASNIGSATTVPTISVDQQGRITAIASTTITGTTPGGTAGGDLSGTYPNPSVAKLQTVGVSATSPTLGQVLKYVSSNWAASSLDLNDLKQTDGTTSVVSAAGCLASQTMYYDTPSKSLKCQSVGSLNASAITAGILPIANGGTGANSVAPNLVFASPAGSTGAPSFRALAAADLPASANLWTEASGNIYRSTGNVGIGTTTTANKLDVNGSMAIGTYAGTAAPANGLLVSGRLSVGEASPGMKFVVADDGTASSGYHWLGGFYRSTGNFSGVLTGYASDGTTDTNGILYAKELAVYTGASAAERLRISSSGNVGIGTSAPASRLSILSTGTSANVSGTEWYLSNGSTYNGWAARAYVENTAGSWGTAPLTISVPNGSGSEVKTLSLLNGNVGIGTNAPQGGLDIKTTGANSALIVPRDTVANRPAGAAAINGMIRYASDTNVLEAYVAGAWTTIGTLGGSQSFAGNVSVGGTLTSTGAATFNSGATIAGGALAMGSQNITGVGANITGSSGMTVASGGTNTNLALQSNGTGAVNLGSTNGVSLSVLNGGASTVNYVTIKGAATGVAPVIATAGSDANIDLSFAPKGTGRTIFSNGNVGIGTALPASPLEISTASTTNYNAPFSWFAPSTPTGQVVQQRFGVSTSTTGNAGELRFIYAGNGSTSNAVQLGLFGLSTGISVQGTGNVGIGTSVPAISNGAGRTYLTVKGSADGGIFEAASGAPDADAATVGAIQFTDINSTATDKRAAAIFTRLSGSTANNRGGILEFWTKPDAGFFSAPRMVVDKVGNVGIGTTVPLGKMEIQEPDDTSAYRNFIASIYGNNASGAQFNSLKARGTVAAPLAIQAGDVLGPWWVHGHDGTGFYNSGGVRFVAEENFSSTAGGAFLQFLTTNTGTRSQSEKMRLTGIGNLGIGTTNPLTPLQVNSGSVNPWGLPLGATAIGSHSITGWTANGIAMANAASGSNIGLLGFNADRMWFGRAVSSSSSGSQMNLDTVTGNVSIGGNTATTRLSVAPNGTSLGSIPGGWGGGIHTFDMYATGTIAAGDGSGGGAGTGIKASMNNAGNIYALGCVQYNGGTLGTCASDIRTKREVSPFKMGLKELLNVNPVYYKYTGEYGTNADGNQMVGVIAQEMEKTLPALIKPIKAKRTPASEEEEIKTVNYSWFSYMAINSIKEIYAKLTGTEQNIAKLAAENAALKAKSDAQARELAAVKTDLQKNNQTVEALKALVCADHPKAAACR